MEKNEEKKRLVDFTKLNVEVTIDKFVLRDVSKPLANYIHQQAEDIAMDDLAHDIYHKGKCMLDDAQAALIVEMIKISNIEPYIRRPLIDIILNVKK